MPEIGTLIEHFPYFGIFILLVLGGIGLPFPEEATLLLTGFLISHHTVKIIPTFLVVYGSLLMTDFFLYLIGKKYGRMIVEHKRFRKVVSSDRLLRIEEKFKKWGIWVVLAGRHLLGLRVQIFLAAGVMKISAEKFIIADAISALITIGLWIGVGYLGVNSVQVLKKDITWVEHTIILMLAIFLVSWIIYWYLKSRRKFDKKHG